MLIRLISLIKKEFITIWEDKRTRAIIMVMPFMMFFVFSAAITMEVRNIDMAVLDNSNSFESKSLIESLHVLFTLYSGFKENAHFQNIKEEKNKDFQSMKF